MKDLVFLGIQGCGKGTQAKLLLSYKPDYRYFEMGQTLRALMSNDNLIGKYITNVVNTGKMVDNFITHDLIDTSLQIAQNHNKYIIIDGFPRVKEQAEFFTTKMEEMGRDFMIVHLELSKDIALERMMNRAGKEGRTDDTPETMQQRIDIFTHETLMVIKHFEEMGKVITINANNSIENIQAELRAKLAL